MPSSPSRCIAVSLSLALLLAACERATVTDPAASAALDRGRPPSVPTMTVVAGGLLDPRGITFGHDGAIYVAEAGTGGTNSTVGQCLQVPPPVGPALGGFTGRISRIDAAGHRTTVADHLPSHVNALGDHEGPADVLFVGNRLYALVDAGCGHGVPTVPSSLMRIEHGAGVVVADLQSFVEQHPVAHPNLGDFEPGGDWYSMVAHGDAIYAVDANGGQIVRIDPERGRITRLIDISAVYGHIVPTAIADGGEAFYVGNLGTFPATPGANELLRVDRRGNSTIARTGFTPILGVVAPEGEQDGTFYVLETIQCLPALPCVPAPFAAGTGRVLRVSRNGTQEVIASGLTFPTALRMGRDHALYVSNRGYGVEPGTGEVVRITLGDKK